MKRFIILAAFLSACQAGSDEAKLNAPSHETTPKVSETAVVVKDGAIRLRLKEPVSEPLACIIPIVVENGLGAKTQVVMIAFSLSGPGDDAKGNMFAPVAEAGEISEARVIVEGQSCDAYDTITVPDDLRCTSGGESCEGQVELMDGKALRFARTG